MKRTLSTFAVGLSICASSALGAFVGIEFVEGDSAAASAAIGANAITFQLFAVFDGVGGNPLPSGANLDNTVISTGFANINTTGSTSFFQQTPEMGGSDKAPNSLFFSLFPALQYDTYGTVGVSDATDPLFPFIAQDPDSVMTTTHIGGGWFNFNPVGNAGSATANANLSTGFGTLLYQMTVLTNGGAGNFNDINSLVTGTFSILTQALGGITRNDVIITSVPTSGALSLFGLAGLAALRRRR